MALLQVVLAVQADRVLLAAVVLQVADGQSVTELTNSFNLSTIAVQTS